MKLSTDAKKKLEMQKYCVPFREVERLTFGQKYSVTVSNRSTVLSTPEDSVETVGNFRSETLRAAKECIEEPLKFRSGIASTAALENIE